jgi:hypothetical protein
VLSIFGGAIGCGAALRIEDGASILISWTMIVTILIFIYPLKAISGRCGTSRAMASGPAACLTRPTRRRTIAIYALGTIAISAEILLLNLRAWQCVSHCD